MQLFRFRWSNASVINKSPKQYKNQSGQLVATVLPLRSKGMHQGSFRPVTDRVANVRGLSYFYARKLAFHTGVGLKEVAVRSS